MSLEKLRAEVFRANSMLVENGLVVLTWGNASGIDRKRGLVVIKPSGISYTDMRPKNLPVVELESGRVVDGLLRPSSDTATHLELYKTWPDIGGVVHTHSTYATAFAQAGKPIACYGTTHADFCPGDIPCVRGLTNAEVESDYEKNTGLVIAATYEENKLDPLHYPGVLLRHHGPFTWGRNAEDAAENALIMESIAKMAFLSRMISADMQEMPSFIRDKHFQRKHGPSAYYGQMKA